MEKLTTDEFAIKENERLKQIKKLENIKYICGEDRLGLKWGQIKFRDFKNNPKAQELVEDYYRDGVNASGLICDNADERQKEILCKLIDVVDGYIFNDWDGDYYTKEQAKKYILNYGI